MSTSNHEPSTSPSISDGDVEEESRRPSPLDISATQKRLMWMVPGILMLYGL
ncbi:MAG: hypothetical protein GY822_08690 [Deltaproteobacteria bacterium]|nr:hypothetical protein [Deltaproteobacteria bacterium]